MKRNYCVRMLSTELENIKNVKHGKVTYMNDIAARNRARIEKNDVVGLYGQNGSGKTALVDVLDMQKRILSGRPVPYGEFAGMLPEEGPHGFTTLFFVMLDERPYLLEYRVELKAMAGKERIALAKETLRWWRRGAGWKTERSLSFVNPFYDKEAFLASSKVNFETSDSCLMDMSLSQRVSQMAIHCAEHGLSIFWNDLNEHAISVGHFENAEEKLLCELISAIQKFARSQFQVVKLNQLADMINSPMLPLNVHRESENEILHGCIPLFMDGCITVSEFVYRQLLRITESINMAMTALVPDLKLELEEVERMVNPEGETEIRVMAYSVRDGHRFSTRYESQGIKRIISLLGCLVAMYNDPGFCLVVDELDAGIFEYLLGELLAVLNEEAAGQLIFTSHNLRVFEKMSHKNIVCTTSNPDERYIRLTGVEKNHNLRDFYLRELLLGGQDEELYSDEELEPIGFAFRQAFDRSCESEL